MNTLIALWRFELRRLSRRRTVIIGALIIPALLYLINAHQPNGAIGGITWKPFFLGSMTALSAISAATSIAIGVSSDRTSGWNQQLRITPLPPTAYAVAKLFTASTLALGSCIALTILGLGFVPPKPTIIAIIPIVFAGSIPFAALGMIAGQLVKPRSTQMVVTFITLPLMFLGGLLVPIPALPGPIRPLVEATPSHHLAQLTRAAIGGRSLPAMSVLAILAYTITLVGLATWTYRKDQTTAGPVT